MKIATLDFETDPFMFGREVAPFACGFYDGEKYFQTWGDHCVEDIFNFLRMYPHRLKIYAHNGGKFDYCFMADKIDNPLQFIQTRMVRGRLFHHELRDSYAVIPVRLSEMQKDEIDYRIFEYGNRDIPENKQAISHYLESDCRYLYEHVERFIAEFGMKLTLGSAAMSTLKKFHSFTCADPEQDAAIRPFYYGGRVECFESGEIHGNLKCYDINSSYPHVMKICQHPKTATFCTTDNPPEQSVYFAHITADSDGALPVKTKSGLSFPRIKNGEFMACSHEINTALDCGLLRIKKIHKALVFPESQDFAEFVDHCMTNKINAELAGDKAMRLFWKLIANSAYGKFGQNPDNYTDQMLFDSLDQLHSENKKESNDSKWTPCGDFGERIIASRPAASTYRLNVATAASITSAARAQLLRAIANATHPIYCDTDSLICERARVPIHKSRLGAWKQEAAMDSLFIAGKKIYAGFLNGEAVKSACKGAVLTPQQIKSIVQSRKPFTYRRDAPSMRLFHPQRFITRQIGVTV